MNLFRADLFRLVRDKSLYIFAAILTALSTLICLVYYFLSKNSSSATEISKVILQCADLGILSTLTGIAVSLYNGKDFTNNTIRNKIGCGESRYKVFFVKLLENYLLAIVFLQ